ncbi:MAG: prolyl oligopeptidase family serine peptidase [Hyphomonadaceae bacterium]|nr:prolyl oligopeptidase family serine peptidase [Hyphomonadaceae bacterium]
MKRLFALALAMGVACLAPSATAQTQPAAAQTGGPIPIPAEAFIREWAIRSPALSPDGRHLAAITSLDGETRALSIWRTDALNQAPTRIGMGGMAARQEVRIASFTWVANDRIFLQLVQPVIAGSGAENKFYTGLARIVDLTGRSIIEPLAAGGARSELEDYADKFLQPSVFDQLANDDQHILMERRTLDDTSIWRVNVYTGRGQRIAQASEREDILSIVDDEGRIRVKQFAELRGGDWWIGYEIFNTANNQWERHPLLQYPARERRLLSPRAFDPENPDLLIFVDNEGSNLAYVRAYSVTQRAFTETLFQHPRFEITNILQASVGDEETRIAGFRYYGDAERNFYTDPTYAAIQSQLEARFPGQYVRFTGLRGDFRLVTVSSSRNPPGYALMRENGELIPLGVSIPQVNPAGLAPSELIYYTARDGLQIPGILTLPRGFRRGVDAPLPTLIMPHGGPWSRNNTDWGNGDVPYAQYFASRGFAVLQPQFRGSELFGDQLWKAGDEQWGAKMQDDKDDGLAWMVSQGIADPQRAVIYGFSYGGFAAMAAAVRPNPPYRCAISGAGVSSLERLGTLWRTNRIQRQLQGWTLKGMDPLENVRNSSIPIMLYHGDYDQTATIWHSEQFAAGLRAAGKPHEYHVLRGYDHGGGTPAHSRQELTLIENFLRGPCGLSY